MFVAFSIYIALSYERYLATYEKNIFGINQSQYIIILNFLLFFLIGMIIYQFLAGGVRIKNIGKEGIELEQVIEENSISAMQTSTELTSNIYFELGELDKVVDYLYSNQVIGPEITEEKYLNVLQTLLSSLVNDKDHVEIKVFNVNNYVNYLKDIVGLANREIKILNHNYKEYGIIRVENGIHIKYEFAPFHNFTSNSCYIVMEFSEIYDIETGKLIYAYIKVFEALYSKYLLIGES